MADESARRERAMARAGRITVTILRPGDPAPAEPGIQGLAGFRLATQLSALAFTLAGQPPRSIPRSEWPVVRRHLRDP